MRDESSARLAINSPAFKASEWEKQLAQRWKHANVMARKLTKAQAFRAKILLDGAATLLLRISIPARNLSESTERTSQIQPTFAFPFAVLSTPAFAVQLALERLNS